METPTCLAWNDKNSIFSSFVSPIVKLFDIETKRCISDFCFNIDKNLPNDFQQANKIIYNSTKSLLVSGHENKQIKFSDPRVQGINLN